MGTNWPEGFDLCIEPSLPEDTPLSSAGSGNKNHPEHHRDLGDAIEAMQQSVALHEHDHSGVGDRFHGPKLLQANTHENCDVDLSVNAIHHTLGTGPHQSAAGDHTHSYSSLTGPPLVVCTSSTRPSSPHTGLLIWETNTLRLYTWTGSKVLFLVGGGEEGIPGVSLRQSKRQRINDDNTWTVVEWDEEVNDAYNFFNKSVSSTDVVVKVAGSYRIEVGLQWDPEFVPDQAEVILSVNGVDTEIRNNQFMRGNLFSPGFSQTLFLSGTLNFQTNDVLRVRVRVKVGSSLIVTIFSFFDPDSKINSRLDMNFIGG